MTLDRHPLDGIGQVTQRQTLPASNFEAIMQKAGYTKSGSAPAKGGRVKIWWIHQYYRVVESIYSPDEEEVITAYHP